MRETLVRASEGRGALDRALSTLIRSGHRVVRHQRTGDAATIFSTPPPRPLHLWEQATPCTAPGVWLLDLEVKDGRVRRWYAREAPHRALNHATNSPRVLSWNSRRWSMASSARP